MIVRLFCPKCAYAVVQKQLKSASIEVPVPVSRISDDGIYEVRCDAGHISAVVLDNLKFELLFDMGLNALYDGYPREAVSSFAVSLERFREFYWRVVMEHITLSDDAVDLAWKPIAKMSERQLGAYVTAVLVLTKQAPNLLNPNKEVPLRNDVIHNGYIPTYEEAAGFGDAVMRLINAALEDLRGHAPDALLSTYKRLSPSEKPLPECGEDDHSGTVNILTAIDVRNPPKGDDMRVGGVAEQMIRITHERQPMRMTILNEEAIMKLKSEHPKRFAGIDLPPSNK